MLLGLRYLSPHHLHAKALILCRDLGRCSFPLITGSDGRDASRSASMCVTKHVCLWLTGGKKLASATSFYSHTQLRSNCLEAFFPGSVLENTRTWKAISAVVVEQECQEHLINTQSLRRLEALVQGAEILSFIVHVYHRMFAANMLTDLCKRWWHTPTYANTKQMASSHSYFTTKISTYPLKTPTTAPRKAKAGFPLSVGTPRPRSAPLFVSLSFPFNLRTPGV